MTLLPLGILNDIIYLQGFPTSLSTFRHSQRPCICTILASYLTLPTLRTGRYCFLGYSDLGGVISYTLTMPIFWGKVTALTSNRAYLVILFPGLSSPSRAYVSYATPGNHFLYSPMTLHTGRYCFLVYPVLGEVVLATPYTETMSCTHQ